MDAVLGYSCRDQRAVVSRLSFLDSCPSIGIMAWQNPEEDGDEGAGWRRIAILGQGATAEVSAWEESETGERLAVKVSNVRDSPSFIWI